MLTNYIIYIYTNSYISELPIKMSILGIFNIIFHFSLLRGRRPLLEARRATFGLRATGWEPLIYMDCLQSKP